MANERTDIETLQQVAKSLPSSTNGRFLSTYARIMKALEIARTGLTQTQKTSLDSIASHMTRIEATKTRMVNNFKEDAPNFDGNLREISALFNILGRSQPQDYNRLGERLGGAKKEVEIVSTMREDLKKSMTDFLAQKDQVSAAVKDAQLKHKSPAELKTIINMMKELEQKQRNLEKSMEKLASEEKHTQRSLYSLHLDVFNVLPLEAKTTTTAPSMDNIAHPHQ